MLKVLLQELYLLEKGFAYLHGSVFQRVQSLGQIINLHRERLVLLAAALFSVAPSCEQSSRRQYRKDQRCVRLEFGLALGQASIDYAALFGSVFVISGG